MTVQHDNENSQFKQQQGTPQIPESIAWFYLASAICLGWLFARLGGSIGSSSLGSVGYLAGGAIGAGIPISTMFAYLNRRRGVSQPWRTVASACAFVGFVAGGIVGFSYGCDVDRKMEDSLHRIVEDGGRPEPSSVMGGGWLIFSVLSGLVGAASGAVIGSITYAVVPPVVAKKEEGVQVQVTGSSEG